MQTILVIEDELSLRQDIVEILRYEKFAILESGDGLSGLRLARAHLPNLIICDIMMPELDGYEVLIELRSDPATTHIPLIFLTAKTNRADMRRGMELGADDFLTKPFSQAELLKAIHTRLEKQARLIEEYEGRLQELRENVIRALPHEIRTPLTGIMSYARMLMDDLPMLDVNQIYLIAQGLDKAAHRLHRLTENYLVYAQLETMADPQNLSALREEQTLNIDVFILDILIQKSHEHARPNYISYDLATADVQVPTDKLEKIISETVDNAFKFSPADTTVRVSGALDGDFYCFQISNLGRGMTPEQIEAIGAYMQFKRHIYEQSGLGLGLVIAKRLVELYGGQLEIKSQPQVETVITIHLPLAP